MIYDAKKGVGPDWLKGSYMPVITPTFPFMNSSFAISE